MATKILNPQECKYTNFFTIGPMIWAQGPLGSGISDRLQIMRVVVIQDATTESRSLFLAKPVLHWNVDLDIYLDNGTKIEINTSDEGLIRKLQPYVWELQKVNPRAQFYEEQNSNPPLTEQERKGLVILMQQLESEKILLKYYIQERDKLAEKLAWDSYAVQVKHKRVLAAEKRIWNLQQRIDKLHAREV